MILTMEFNCPLGQNSARISFGSPNIEDEKKCFRIGVILSKELDKIRYHKAGWISGGKIRESIVFDVRRGDKVVVESKGKKAEKSETRNVFDTDKEWPAKAYGPSIVCRPWYF